MVKELNSGIVVLEFWTPAALSYSLSDKYSWETYDPPFPPIDGLNSTTTLLWKKDGFVIK